MADTNTTNGTDTSAPKSSKLDLLHADFEKNFKGKTTKKRTEELVKNFQTAQTARKTADEKAQAAADAESKAAEAIIREASGKQRVTIGGENLMPMSRGERVFFRREAVGSVDLGG